MKTFRSAVVTALVALALTICGSDSASAAKVIKIGASPTPHAEILRAAEPLLKAKAMKCRSSSTLTMYSPTLP